MDKNLRLFSSTLHKAVWRTSIDYFPLEYSTANIKDPELLQSCQEFYHYIIDGLEDVLEHPEEYRNIPEKYLIIFCGILTFHHYMLERFLKKACIKEKDHLVIDNVEYDNLLCWVKKKICNRELKLDCLMKTLGRKGIRITRDENQTVIRNDRYPHMFYSAALLKQVAVNYYNRTKRTPEQFKLLDFASIGNERRKLILEDVIAPLYDDEKEYVYRFVDETKKKVRLTCSCRLWYYRTSKFKYKGKVLFLANWGGGHYDYDKSIAEWNDGRIDHEIAMFRLFIPMPSLDSPAYQYLQSEIEKLPNKEEFKDLFIKNIRTCTFCNPDCVKWNAYKKDWIILGRPVGKLIRSCEFAVAAYTFNKENYTFFSQLIDIFIRMIDLQLI